MNAQNELAFRKRRLKDHGHDPDRDPRVAAWRGENARLSQASVLKTNGGPNYYVGQRRPLMSASASDVLPGDHRVSSGCGGAIVKEQEGRTVRLSLAAGARELTVH